MFDASGNSKSRGFRRRHVPVLLASLIWAVVASAQADDGDRPAIYGPSNIGSLENGAVVLENEAMSTRSAEAISPCATTFSGPSLFTWVGTTNPVASTNVAATAGPSFSGCAYNATSDASWLVVTSSAGSATVTYTVAANQPSAVTRVGHLHIVGAGVVFSLTVTQYGSGPAYHSRDYTGTGYGQLVVWRPSNATWYVEDPITTPATTLAQQWGLSGDVPVLGDFDGDGVADFTVWRPSNGTWYVLPSTNINQPITRSWGVNGDIPLPADYDGDGKTDFAVYRPSNQMWFIIDSSTGAGVAQQFGLSGDIPVPGDYDGDGKVDIGVFRPSTAVWYFLGSRDGLVHSQQLGLPTDIPVPTTNYVAGVFNIWRPSTGQFYSQTFGGSVTSPSQLGLNGDVPLVSFGVETVWRPSTGTWYLISGGGPYVWGLNGDVIPGAPHTATQ